MQRIFSKRAVQTPSSQGRVLAALLLSFTAAACTDDSKPDVVDVEAGPDSAVPRDGGGGDARSDDARVELDAKADSSEAGGGALDAYVPPADTGVVVGTDATVDAGVSTDAAVGDAGVVGGVGAPMLTTGNARQVGRFGGDLRIDLSTVRGAQTIVAVRVELLTSQLATLGSARTVPLETLVTALTGDSHVLLDGIFERYSNVFYARVSLVDELGARSPNVDLTVARQATLLVDAACDDKFLANRCGTGLGCKAPSVGAAKVCSAGVAPQLARLGYFVDELGPRIVFEGTDADADVTGYQMRFYDEQDVLVEIDHDVNADSPPVSEVTGSIDAQDSSAFFKRLVPTPVLVDQVFRVRVNVIDSVDNSSNVLVADRSAAPEHALGTTCDARTFNRCSDGGWCVDSGDQHRCLQATEAQNSACTAALILSPSSGVTRVRGSLHSSLWDAPQGCSATVNQDDRVVKLVLTDPAVRVTLSTDHPYTGFDTAIYVLSSCTATPLVERCNAPTPGSAARSVLTLQNLAAGEYFVVVDSFPSPDDTSDTFELTVAVE